MHSENCILNWIIQPLYHYKSNYKDEKIYAQSLLKSMILPDYYLYQKIGISMRIILITKDTNEAKLLNFQLEKKGFRITHNETVEDALKLCQTQKCDIIIINIENFVNFDNEYLKIFKENNPEILIILTVEFGSVDMAIHACKQGADDYITKPFAIEHLLYTIEKLKKMRELINENQLLQQKLKNRHNINDN